MMTRSPAVAGRFYPAISDDLKATVDGLLQAAKPADRPPKALIVPHAGYIYSGPIAATAFAQVTQAEIERVVIVGPAHRVYLAGMVSPGATRLRTPLGDLEVDVDALARVPEVTESPRVHAQEHSIEVMLPFLQRLEPDLKIIPIAASHTDPEVVGRMLESLWGGPETLIVISSDLSHHLPYDAARAIDRRTAARIEARQTDLTGDEACGCTGINGLAWVARRHGARIELLDLRSSGDTAGGRDEVVGYGAFALHEAA
jgi:AmmeMemoRadiSam system protein B